MSRMKDSKTAGQKLRELFWEKKKARRISPELIEIFKKQKDTTSNKEIEKKVARLYRSETGV